MLQGVFTALNGIKAENSLVIAIFLKFILISTSSITAAHLVRAGIAAAHSNNDNNNNNNHDDNKNKNACQPELGACGASLSLQQQLMQECIRRSTTIATPESSCCMYMSGSGACSWPCLTADCNPTVPMLACKQVAVGAVYCVVGIASLLHCHIHQTLIRAMYLMSVVHCVYT